MWSVLDTFPLRTVTPTEYQEAPSLLGVRPPLRGEGGSALTLWSLCITPPSSVSATLSDWKYPTSDLSHSPVSSPYRPGNPGRLTPVPVSHSSQPTRVVLLALVPTEKLSRTSLSPLHVRLRDSGTPVLVRGPDGITHGARHRNPTRHELSSDASALFLLEGVSTEDSQVPTQSFPVPVGLTEDSSECDGAVLDDQLRRRGKGGSGRDRWGL